MITLVKDNDAKARLEDRIEELCDLVGKISRLSFYISTLEDTNTHKKETYKKQLEIMIQYKEVLEYRIMNGMF